MFDLSSISNLIADSALGLGGSDLAWHQAEFCPYVRDDGTPCYDETRGSPWMECPICGGRGAIYKSPRYNRGIYTDNSNKFFPDGSGGFMRGNKTLSLPRDLPLKLLKSRNTQDARRLLRDKFQLLGPCCNPDGSREIAETLYMIEDPVKPTINSGTIYQTVIVENNY